MHQLVTCAEYIKRPRPPFLWELREPLVVSLSVLFTKDFISVRCTTDLRNVSSHSNPVKKCRQGHEQQPQLRLNARAMLPNPLQDRHHKAPTPEHGKQDSSPVAEVHRSHSWMSHGQGTQRREDGRQDEVRQPQKGGVTEEGIVDKRYCGPPHEGEDADVVD